MNRLKKPDLGHDLEQFIDKAQENLQIIEKELLSLEHLSIPEQMVIVWRVFYTNYLIRTNTYILTNDYIQEVLYCLENTLLTIKQNQLEVDQKIVSLMLEIYDAISLFFAKLKPNPESIDAQSFNTRNLILTKLIQLNSYLQYPNNQQVNPLNNLKNPCVDKNPNSVHQNNFDGKKAETTSEKFRFDKIIQFAFENNLTDIYLSDNEIPRFRNYQGKIIPGKYPPSNQKILNQWLNKILTKDEMELLKTNQDIFKIFDYNKLKIRIRFQIFNTYRGIAIILHLIPQKIPTIEELSFPLIFKRLSDKNKGLILITGAANSGKSTTVAAMLDYINKHHNKYIITLETLIEFVHQSHQSWIKQIEIGQHIPNSNLAFSHLMKHNPHVIFMDSLDNAKSFNMALKAVGQGCLVIGILNTNTVLETFLEITSFYSSESQEKIRTALSKSLLAIISQGLCPTLDKKQIPYYDILLNTATIKNYIIQGKFSEILPLMEQNQFLGMTTMNQSLLKLYQQGKITKETAIEKASLPFNKSTP